MPEKPTPLAELFLHLWKKANTLSRNARLTASPPDDNFKSQVQAALQMDSAQEAQETVTKLLATKSKKLSPDQKNGRILASMHAIDELFYLIHPRAQILPSKASDRARLPEWLEAMRDARFLSGEYGQSGQLRLVPRGPLLRLPRDENASSAETLADRFKALCVVPTTVKIQSQAVKTTHVAVNLDPGCGVPSGSDNGREQIVFIPVAEHGGDLLALEREVRGQKFVDYRLRPGLNAAQHIAGALQASGPADIAFAPELVVPEQHADELAGLLARADTDMPRMTVAGSGQTVDENGDQQAWNEARILNQWGAELWRQRKIWPAGLDSRRSLQLGLSDPAPKLLMEDTAEGDTVVIADIESIGRCVVLICQDFEAVPMAQELVLYWQPDWIFVPVLDTGISIGRWTHQQALALSKLSNARFLVASSTAYGAPDARCGLAVGPMASNPANYDTGRAVALVRAAAGTSPGYAALKWGKGDEWKQSAISSA